MGRTGRGNHPAVQIPRTATTSSSTSGSRVPPKRRRPTTPSKCNRRTCLSTTSKSTCGTGWPRADGTTSGGNGKSSSTGQIPRKPADSLATPWPCPGYQLENRVGDLPELGSRVGIIDRRLYLVHGALTVDLTCRAERGRVERFVSAAAAGGLRSPRMTEAREFTVRAANQVSLVKCDSV